MRNILQEIKDNAKSLNKTIVLPEGEDSRVVVAASLAVKEGLARVTLLGNPEEIAKNNREIDKLQQKYVSLKAIVS